jgi:Lysylphosphatidylglycerol synthase TM region
VRCPPAAERVDSPSAAGEETTFHRPNWRLLGSLGYLWFDIAVLWLLLRGLGEAPSVPALVLAYTIGYIANMLPIPGGIGVLDAGLAGALALYGIAPAHAAAAVLVYHAIALWVPGVGGLVGYVRVRPRVMNRYRPGNSLVSAATSTSRSASSPTASSNAVA